MEFIHSSPVPLRINLLPKYLLAISRIYVATKKELSEAKKTGWTTRVSLRNERAAFSFTVELLEKKLAEYSTTLEVSPLHFMLHKLKFSQDDEKNLQYFGYPNIEINSNRYLIAVYTRWREKTIIRDTMKQLQEIQDTILTPKSDSPNDII